MTRSVAANCEACLKVENGIGFHHHPGEAEYCGPRQRLGSFQAAPRHPESSAEAAYRCSPATAPGREAGGALGVSLGESFPKSRLSPRVPAALSPCFPYAFALARSGKDAGSPSEAPPTGIWEGMARGRGFPSSLQQVWLRESFSKFPAASAQVASAGRGDGGERASLVAASTELWAHSLGAARVPGGQALLPGAKATADAGGSEGGSRPPQLLQPYRGAYTWGLHRSPGRAPRGRSSGGALGCLRATGSSTFLLGSFFLGPGSPGQWSAGGGSRAAMPPGRSRNLQPLLNSSPPQQPGGKGRVQ